jgi:3-oxoacyl-(acyl-carrier-protein) synthase
MSTVFVARQSASTSLGPCLQQMCPRLYAGESAISEIRRFNTAKLPCHVAGLIQASPESAYEEDLVCRLMLPVLKQIGTVPEQTYVIWTGIKANANYVERLYKELPRPSRYLPRHYREWICGFFGLPQDQGMEINAACASSTYGLALAAEMIRQDECKAALVCAADPVSHFIFTGFAALRALSPTVCRPFDIERDGLWIGEGAFAMLLVSESFVEKLNYKPLALLSGWGMANDANHITAPSRSGSGLIRAICAALQSAKMDPQKIQAFCTHGTGTLHNDSMELTAIESIFGDRRFPIFSIKGAIGHTMGAAGGIEAAVSISAMYDRTVPATAGLVNAEARAMGKVSGLLQLFSGNNILTTNSGFGGCNAALIFRNT